MQFGFLGCASVPVTFNVMSQQNPDLGYFAERWIEFWLLPENSLEQYALLWVTDREYDLVRENPDEAWFLILEILRRNNSSQILEVLPAGLLEDLLTKHGERLICAVESEAKANPSFATLLGGVWRNSISEGVWSRVEQVRDCCGWDGNTGA